MKYIYWPIFIPLTPLHLFGQSIFPADKPHSLVPSFLPPSPFVASLLQQPTILFLSSSLSSSFPCPFLSIASLLSLIDIHSLSEASVRLGHKSLRTLMKRSSSWYLPGEPQRPYPQFLSPASLILYLLCVFVFILCIWVYGLKRFHWFHSCNLLLSSFLFPCLNLFHSI